MEGTTSTNWSFASNRLTAGASGGGTYLLKFSLSFSGDVTTWKIGLSINGEIPADSVQRTISNTNKDLGNVSGLAQITLSGNDYVELVVKPSASGDFTPVQAQVVAVELTDNSSSYYGGMTIYNNSTAQSLSSGSFETITGFSLSGRSNGWSLNSNELVAGESSAGTYLASFSISVTGDNPDGNPADLTIGIALNGTSNDPVKIITDRKTSSADIGNIVGCGILTIAAGDKISLEIKSDKNDDPVFHYCSVTLHKIGGSGSAPYGAMSITSDQTVNISGIDSWTTIGTFTAGTLNDWSFNANVLNPTSGTTSAGFYSIDYSLSVNSPSASDAEDFEVGVFIGADESSDLTIKRRLSGSSDVGAAGGTGLLNIASVDSTVTVKIRNLTNSNDFTIKAAKLVLHRFVEGSHDGSLPVELLWLKAYKTDVGNKLAWKTGAETDNLGFIVYRTSRNSRWEKLASYRTNRALTGLGNSTQGKSYAFLDKRVRSGVKYQYRLADVDFAGNLNFSRPVTPVAIPEKSTKDNPLHLTSFPNPFNPVTTIQFELEEARQVTVEIFTMRGTTVRRLYNGPATAGLQQLIWDGRTESGTPAGSGMYLIALDTGTERKLIKGLLIR